MHKKQKKQEAVEDNDDKRQEQTSLTKRQEQTSLTKRQEQRSLTKRQEQTSLTKRQEVIKNMCCVIVLQPDT